MYSLTLLKFSKNPYGRKREGGGNTHYDLGVTTPSVEVNGSVEYMVPSV